MTGQVKYSRSYKFKGIKNYQKNHQLSRANKAINRIDM